jgi:hypothetical protein
MASFMFFPAAEWAARQCFVAHFPPWRPGSDSRSDRKIESLHHRWPVVELNLRACNLLLGRICIDHEQRAILPEFAPHHARLRRRHPVGEISFMMVRRRPQLIKKIGSRNMQDQLPNLPQFKAHASIFMRFFIAFTKAAHVLRNQCAQRSDGTHLIVQKAIGAQVISGRPMPFMMAETAYHDPEKVPIPVCCQRLAPISPVRFPVPRQRREPEACEYSGRQ